MLQDSPDALVGHAHQFGDRVDRHLPSQDHHQGLEQQREAALFARPWHVVNVKHFSHPCGKDISQEHGKEISHPYGKQFSHSPLE
jgi:hypothetical protein